MKTYRLADSSDFKESNLLNWKDNTAFWLQAKLRHVGHVLPYANKILAREAERVGPSFSLVDVGCGDAWVSRIMKDAGIQGAYAGLDFNPVLIEDLQSLRGRDNSSSFRQVDIEVTLPVDLIARADLVVNAFNFFELPSLAPAFANHVSMLRDGGALLVMHIDPLSQLLSVANDLNEFHRELEAFEEFGSRLAYDKTIDLKDGQAARVYKGILYKISEYHHLARQHALVLEDFEEILHARDGRPQLYQIALWRRPCLKSQSQLDGRQDET